MKIESAVILITSASSILGRSLAIHYAHLGARLILCDHDETNLMKTVQLCRQVNDQLHSCILTSCQPKAVEAILDFVQETYHQAPDVLINHWPNTVLPSFVDKAASEQFVQQWSTLTAHFFLFGYACAQRMRQANNSGVIVNVISYGEAMESNGLVSASSMVSGFTQSWAQELTPFNIRVGGVIPQLSNEAQRSDILHYEELTRHTEYIVANEYFSGRVMTA